VPFCKQLLPLVVTYIMDNRIYSWSVHPARGGRTHSITVTVRSVHSMVSCSMIVYQLAVHAKHKGGTRANPDDCIMKVKKIFRTLRGWIGAIRLYHCLPECQSQCKTGPAHYQHPLFNIPRSAPEVLRNSDLCTDSPSCNGIIIIAPNVNRLPDISWYK